MLILLFGEKKNEKGFELARFGVGEYVFFTNVHSNVTFPFQPCQLVNVENIFLYKSSRQVNLGLFPNVINIIWNISLI